MKRIIVCCDGTWNTPDQEENNLPAPTNVVRLFNALSETDDKGNKQEKYYHTGVGTEGSLLSKTAGGIYGEGLDKNIKSGYYWLANIYEPNDLIYLFGFSRGAYTVRSLGGLVQRCGLAVLKGVATDEAWKRVDVAYQKGYMQEDEPKTWLPQEWQWLDPGAVPIEFIGVWDTVGARGIPDDLAILNLFDDPDEWRFYDTNLGKNVKKARHAIAMDEMRASFTPTLWTDEQGEAIYSDASGRVKQLWFPGVHCDVGGGYSDTGLSDIALAWMMDEASETGLKFEEDFREQVKPNPKGILHDSYKGVFKVLRTRPRNLPNLDLNQNSDHSPFHPSSIERHRRPPISQAPYHPTRILDVGDEVSLSIYAAQHWNRTSIYLESGATYDFTATGQWLDRNVPCGPGGANDGTFRLGELVHLAGSVWGKVEGVFAKVSGNKNADFIGTRRIESEPWFSLIGVIANDGETGDANPLPDGSPSPHQYFRIGDRRDQFKVRKSGYLYAFANDAWHFYDNNRGSVLLTVKRSG